MTREKKKIFFYTRKERLKKRRNNPSVSLEMRGGKGVDQESDLTSAALSGYIHSRALCVVHGRKVL